MSSLQISHQDIGASRIGLQYSASQKFKAFVAALLASADELESVLQSIALVTDIDSAAGVNLDTIGEIVGVGRIVPNSLALTFFGFQGFTGADVFGEESSQGVGSRFRDELEPATATTVLADPEYRLLIRAKIIRNHSSGTCEDFLKSLAFIFGVPYVGIDDFGGMVIGIAVGRPLTFQEKAIIQNIDILPRPAGVLISQRVAYNRASSFGFADQPLALKFGEEGSSTGGIFSEAF